MTAPTQEEGPVGDACMADLTNEAWLKSHLALFRDPAIPATELAYLYDPDRDPDTVTVDELSVAPDPKEPRDA